ncbi:endonuclease domain-containing protein [Mycolicibacterium sp. Dal123E01]|uniref:endonuclease domain-containing protein n=1 Tax=Mycolicibacterium sp. Dal123E01 TaxID=3457578 RepID=UPI00403E7897
MTDLKGPFLASEALAAGIVTRHQLRTHFQSVHRNVYVPSGQRLTPLNRAVAAWLWSARRATLAGMSASAVFRTKWIDDWLPAELNRSARDKTTGILLHSDVLADDETCVRNGMALTTPARTAFDLGRRKGLQTAVIRIDALAHVTELKIADVDLLIDRHRGARGLVQLRRALDLVDGGSESPWETRTRLALVSAGLPSPRTQIPVCDRGCVIARIDMGWEEFLVGVEFDGAQHWTDPAQRTWDIDRLAQLEALGWRIVRVSADLLRHRPAVLTARVLDALRAAGAPV